MKAIETMYAGTLFRSRLEARWAVFFDELGIEWEFEPEGFLVGPNAERPYLPDFLLPEINVWVEVKGAEDALDRTLLEEAIDYGAGLPHVAHDRGWAGTDEGGLLVLGPIPRPREDSAALHPLLQWHKGVVIQFVAFDDITGVTRTHDYQMGFNRSEPLLEPRYRGLTASAAVNAAYAAARSARFEHSHREVWSTASR